MKFEIQEANYENIKPLRAIFLTENNFQIRYDSCHWRNWSDEYFLILDGRKVGYGSVKGFENLSDRDTVFEFFVLPPFRKFSEMLFENLIQTSKCTFLECQTNDKFLADLAYQFAKNIRSEVILFEDAFVSNIEMPELIFRKRIPGENVFGKKESDIGEYVLVKNEEVVADGGFLLHYNPPFTDLYMETAPKHRKKGYASFILQELKKECYLAGRVPAARCNKSNPGSKKALLNAGMKVAGYMISGELK